MMNGREGRSKLNGSVNRGETTTTTSDNHLLGMSFDILIRRNVEDRLPNGNRREEGASKRHFCFIFYRNTSLVGIVIRQFRLYSSLIHYRPILPLILRFIEFCPFANTKVFI